MGHLADDMIDGSSCSYCGVYFEHPDGGIYTHGYPVACWDCHDEDSDIPKSNVRDF